MTRIAVVWEDARCEVLGELVRRSVRAMALAPGAEAPRLVRHTVRGNAAFERYVATTWPLARARGVPGDAGPIDHLICVADADRLHDRIAAVTRPPRDAPSVASWLVETEGIWQAWLRARCDPAGPSPATVHGKLLRWSKESLVLAGYDQPAMAKHLGLDPRTLEREEFRAQCPIHPSAVGEEVFTDTFQRPLGCLQALTGARSQGAVRKNDPVLDDVLQALSRESLAVVCARVPDLTRLSALIWDLHRG